MLVLLLLLASCVAQAEKRVALVIGNSAYKHAGVLPNPMNDAADVATILKLKGFLVIEGQDLNKSAFVSKVQEFGRAIMSAEIAVFFFAGHGVPTDAELATPAALDVELVPTSSVYNAMRNEPRFKIQQHMMQRAVTPPIECILVSTVLHSFAIRRFVGALA